MKISAERRSWKNLRRQAAGDPEGGMGVQASGFGYVRGSMDLPQLRLAVGGNYDFPAVSIALRVAGAWIIAYLFYGRNLTLDFALHMLNISVNGWTYGLICELAVCIPNWQPILTVKLMFWAAVMKATDILLAGWVDENQKTSMTGVQESLRPVFLVLVSWLILKEPLAQLFAGSFILNLPSPVGMAEIATSMAMCFLYRLGKQSVLRPAWAEYFGFWLKHMTVLTKHITQWPFWLPVWAALGALAFRFMGGLSANIQWYMDYLLGLLLIPALSPLWSVIMDWFDGNCMAIYEY